MAPFIPNNFINLSGKRVFLFAGRIDPIVPESQTEYLFEILRKNNADVFLKWQQAGHNLAKADIIDSRHWISEKFY
jgi:phospholipase/carboxylesterase